MKRPASKDEAPAQAAASAEIGLYVHVPFCCQKCRYCSFYSVTASEDDYVAYLKALAIEWELLRKEEFADSPAVVSSIYLGGGTPSILGGRRVAGMLDMLRQGPRWAEGCEISIETNPEDITHDLVSQLLDAGVNRISVGVQSFDDHELELLGRVCNADGVRRALGVLRDSGCENLNLDLIYGIPDQTVHAWRSTLAEALGFEPHHLSCYLLTPEQDTILNTLLRGNVLTTPLEEVLLQQFELAREEIADAGLEHYEISNFAYPESRCRHNVGTWSRRPYLGLGPSAHSFNGEVRWRNAANLQEYLSPLLTRQQRPVLERYRLSDDDIAKEVIFLGLRLADGLTWAGLEAVTDAAALGRVRRRAQFLAGTGFLEIGEQGFRLAQDAYFVSNAVIVELIRALEEKS
jgi:oxygen-independent coproporphyrinogen-3 oxidase